MRLFRSKGFEGTTMRGIANAAGVSLGSAYYYFAGKEHLIQAFYDQMQDDHLAAAARSWTPGPTSPTGSRGVLDAWVDVAGAVPRVRGHVLQERRRADQPAVAVLPESRRARDASIAIFAEVVGGLRPQGRGCARRDCPSCCGCCTWASCCSGCTTGAPVSSARSRSSPASCRSSTSSGVSLACLSCAASSTTSSGCSTRSAADGSPWHHRVVTRLRAVIFDLDDTLVDQTSAARAASIEWGRTHGLVGSDEELSARWSTIATPHYRRYQLREVTFPEQRRARAREFLPHLDLVADKAADEVFRGYLDLYEVGWTCFPDAVPALRRVREAGLFAVVLTNGEHAHQRLKLELVGLVDEVDAMFTSDQFRRASRILPRSSAPALRWGSSPRRR